MAGLRVKWVGGVAIALLCGCAFAPRVGPAALVIPPLPDRCGIATLPPMVGQPLVALADVNLQGPLRAIWPAQEVTSELQPGRLNAQLDAEGVILRLFCG
jgi:hypothetical protein